MKLISSGYGLRDAAEALRRYSPLRWLGLELRPLDKVYVAGITAGVLIFCSVAFPLMAAKATASAEETGQALSVTATPCQLSQGESQGEAEGAAVTAANESLPLAMGIDAVISSVPGGEYASDVTMLMVGEVIVNRTRDCRFPDTVEGVLTAPYQFSCFSSTGVRWVGRAAYDEGFKQRCLAAAEAVLAGKELLGAGVVYVSGGQQGVTVAQLDGLYFGK